MSKAGASATRKRKAHLALVGPAPWQGEHFTHARPLAMDSAVTARPVLGRTVPMPQIHRWHPDRYTEPSWPQVDGALTDAESGLTERLADLFVRMVSSDAHLSSLRESRIGLVAGASWKVEANPRARPGSADYEIAKRAADDCTSLLEGLGNLERIFADILDGIFVGWSVQEIVWGLRGSDVIAEEVVWLSPRRFRFDREFNIYVWDQGSEQRYLEPNKFIVHIPRSGVPTYPPLSGALVPCVRPWWIKLWARKYWLVGGDASGNPRLLGTVPQEADDAVVYELYKAMQTLAADGVGVKRDSTLIEVLDTKARGDDSIWSALVKHSDAEMSKGVLGSTLNVEVTDTGGNRAAAESQGDVTIGPRAERDQRGMWSTIARDFFTPFLRFNAHRYGGRMPPVPRGSSTVWEPPVELDDIAIRYGRVKVDEVRTSRGLQPKGSEGGGDDEVVPEPVGGPAGPAPFARSPASRSTSRLPRNPWDRAIAMALRGRGATETSGR